MRMALLSRCHPRACPEDPLLRGLEPYAGLQRLHALRYFNCDTACGTMDPRDKPEDDSIGEIITTWQLAR